MSVIRDSIGYHIPISYSLLPNCICTDIICISRLQSAYCSINRCIRCISNFFKSGNSWFLHLCTITETFFSYGSSVCQYSCQQSNRSFCRVLWHGRRDNRKVRRFCNNVGSLSISYSLSTCGISTNGILSSWFEVLDTQSIVGQIVYNFHFVFFCRKIAGDTCLFPAETGKKYLSSPFIKYRSRNRKAFLIRTGNFQRAKYRRITCSGGKTPDFPFSYTITAMGICTIIVSFTGFKPLELDDKIVTTFFIYFHFSIFGHTLQSRIKDTVFFYNHSFCFFHAS